ncbi:MAG TPA: DUF4397 domain-containing protein [Aggregatilineaceae bacterium]|nr:DUF4397 domain-containing protein [Aggregatilineaceae bacterium]
MRKILLWMLLLLVVLVACGGGDEDNKTPVPPTRPVTSPIPATPIPTATYTPLPMPEVPEDKEAESAQLRMVHASADLPKVSFYLDGLLLERNFSVGISSQTPRPVAPGSYTLRVVNPEDDVQEVKPYAELPLTLKSGQFVTALLVGEAENAQLVLYEEDLAPLPEHTARLSVINAVSQTGPIQLFEGSEPLVDAVGYPTVGGPVEIAAGAHAFDFKQGEETLTSYNMGLDERKVYTLVLVGQPDNYRVLRIESLAQRETQVRVIQVSPDAPQLDIYLGDTPIATDMGYREATEWATYATDTYQLRIRPAGQPEAEPLAEREVKLTPYGALDIILLDSFQQLKVIQVDEDLSMTPVNAARFTFVHAALGVKGLKIETLGGSLPGISEIGLGGATRPTLLNDGLWTLSFFTSVGGEDRQVDYLADYNFPAGGAYTIIATGMPNTIPLVLATEVGADPGLLASAEGLVEMEEPTGDSEFMLRVVNALSSGSPVTFEVGDEMIFDDIQQGTTTPYHTFNTESTMLVVRDKTSGNIILQEEFVPLSNPRSVLFLYMDGYGTVQAEIASDNSDPVPQGNAQVRVLHVATQKPDLVLRGETLDGAGQAAPAATADAEAVEPTPVPLISLSEPATIGRPTNPVLVVPGTYRVHVYERTTDILVLTVPEMRFDAGVFYDLILLPDETGLSLNPVLIAQPQ